MEIAFNLKARNGPLFKYRQLHNLTQKKAAFIAGVAHTVWNGLECLRFHEATRSAAGLVADAIGCHVNAVMPEEAVGRDHRFQRTIYRRVQLAELECSVRTEERLQLPSPKTDILMHELGDVLHERINTLDDRLAEILKRRYGLNGQTPETLVTIAKALGLVPNRVRQLEYQALQELSVDEGLVNYLSDDEIT